MRQSASILWGQGFNVIPCIDKACVIPTWSKYQSSRQSESDFDRDFNRDADQIAMIMGFGGLEAIDMDGGSHIEDWLNHMVLEDLPHSDIADIFEDLVIQRTPSGGYHLIFRCESSARNEVLLESKVNKDAGKKCRMVETRANGGYIIVSPSVDYVLMQGDMGKIPTLSIDDRSRLIDYFKYYRDDDPDIINTLVEKEESRARKILLREQRKRERANSSHSYPDIDSAFNENFDLLAFLENQCGCRSARHGRGYVKLKGGHSKNYGVIYYPDSNRMVVQHENWSVAPRNEEGYTASYFLRMHYFNGDGHEAVKFMCAYLRNSGIPVPGDNSPAPHQTGRIVRSGRSAGPVEVDEDEDPFGGEEPTDDGAETLEEILGGINEIVFDAGRPFTPKEPLVKILSRGESSFRMETFIREGSLVVLSGASKSRKSAIVKMVVSALISKKGSYLNLQASPVNRKILMINTEEEQEEFELGQRMIMNGAGYEKGAQPDNYIAISTRKIGKQKSFDIMTRLIKTGEIGTLIIDGYVDIFPAGSIMDLDVAEKAVESLMALHDNYDLTTIGVIHATADKARGHVGSELIRKATSIMHVKLGGKDTDRMEDRWTTCYMQPSRIAGFSPFAFNYKQDKEGIDLEDSDTIIRPGQEISDIQEPAEEEDPFSIDSFDEVDQITQPVSDEDLPF